VTGKIEPQALHLEKYQLKKNTATAALCAQDSARWPVNRPTICAEYNLGEN
jgi:hypothetical protein